MTSLREILKAHAPVLVLDAASSSVQVGWLTNDAAPHWNSSETEAGIGVFAGIEALGIDVGQAGAFVFCEGPGSVLGTRTAAMAIRTWNVLRARPVFAYSSLALVAHGLERPDASVIVDARRESWHRYQLGRGLQRVTGDELATQADLVMPDGFRHWAPLPARVSRVSYVLSDLFSRLADVELFRPTTAPDAFLHEEPSYVTWTPQVHRAPHSP